MLTAQRKQTNSNKELKRMIYVPENQGFWVKGGREQARRPRKIKIQKQAP